jgi:hypothetical protein
MEIEVEATNLIQKNNLMILSSKNPNENIIVQKNIDFLIKERWKVFVMKFLHAMNFHGVFATSTI